MLAIGDAELIAYTAFKGNSAFETNCDVQEKHFGKDRLTRALRTTNQGLDLYSCSATFVLPEFDEYA